MMEPLEAGKRRRASDLPWRRELKRISLVTEHILWRQRGEAIHQYRIKRRAEIRKSCHPVAEIERLREELACWPECPTCGHTHRSDENYLRCGTWEEHGRRLKEAVLTTPWDPKGTKEPFTVMEGYDEASFWLSIRDLILARDEHLCQSCGRAEEKVMHQSTTFGLIVAGVTEETRQEVHHIIPRHRGGSDHPRNLMTLCYRCHTRTMGNGYKKGIAPGFEPALESFDGHAGG